MKTKAKRSTVVLIITLCLLILTSVINWGVVTGWGNVKITRLTLVGGEEKQYSALLYVPRNATKKTPAPAILMFHGNSGNARNHESWAVEFSRRGFVVLSTDALGSGDSGADGAADSTALVTPQDMYFSYLAEQPFVDKDNILTSGHSMGNASAAMVGAKHNVKGIILASNDMDPAVLLDFTGRYADFTGPYIENYRNYQGAEYTVTSIVEPISKGKNLDQFKEYFLPILQGRKGFEDATDFQLDTMYGSFEEGNAFMCTIEYGRIHEAAFVTRQTIGHILWFGQELLGDAVPNPIDSNDQVWQIKDYVGLVGILVFAAFLCNLAIFITDERPFFAEVKQPLPRNIGLRKVGLAISLVCGVVFPWLALKFPGLGIIPAKANKLPIFKLGYATFGLSVVFAMSLLGLVTFIIFCLTDGRKQKMQACDLGLTPQDKGNRFSAAFIGKSFLLAMIVIAIGWAYIQLQAYVFGTDFYAWFFGVKPLPPAFKLPYYIPYILVWMFCFVISSFGINVERRLPSLGKGETVDTLVQLVVNVLVAAFTITLVIIVQWKLESAGVFKHPFWGSFGLDTNRLWGMPVGIAVGTGGSTYLFRKTGNTWLCAFLMGTCCAIMCCLYGQLRL